jgi:hypothetical protein
MDRPDDRRFSELNTERPKAGRGDGARQLPDRRQRDRLHQSFVHDRMQPASQPASRSSTVSPSAARCSRAAWQYGQSGLTYMTTLIIRKRQDKSSGAGRITPRRMLLLGRNAAVRRWPREHSGCSKRICRANRVGIRWRRQRARSRPSSKGSSRCLVALMSLLCRQPVVAERRGLARGLVIAARQAVAGSAASREDRVRRTRPSTANGRWFIVNGHASARVAATPSVAVAGASASRADVDAEAAYSAHRQRCTAAEIQQALLALR